MELIPLFISLTVWGAAAVSLVILTIIVFCPTSKHDRSAPVDCIPFSLLKETYEREDQRPVNDHEMHSLTYYSGLSTENLKALLETGSVGETWQRVSRLLAIIDAAGSYSSFVCKSYLGTSKHDQTRSTWIDNDEDTARLCRCLRIARAGGAYSA